MYVLTGVVRLVRVVVRRRGRRGQLAGRGGARRGRRVVYAADTAHLHSAHTSVHTAVPTNTTPLLLEYLANCFRRHG